MALMYKTTMSPTKLELIAAWLPSQPWFSGDASAIENLGGYRFDDPAGEVGVEGILVTAGDETVYHVPLTYRGAPLEGGDEFLVGTSEHGVHGARWISDAAGDPVYRDVFVRTIATGGHGADEFVANESGGEDRREIAVPIQGSGAPGREVPNLQDASVENFGTVTRLENGSAVLDIVRVIDLGAVEREDQLSMRATWRDQPVPAILALLYAG